MEIFSAFDLIKAGVPKVGWLEKLINVVEEDLFVEWLDGGGGKVHSRQTKETLERYGLLTRYTGIHYHPLLASCEDGKDHNWISLTYGDKYLPVQLNSIIYGILDHLVMYYNDRHLGNNLARAGEYSELKEQFLQDFQEIFWCENGKWTGFRNYLIIPGSEGQILYGDLAAEIFPLFNGIATAEQAEITKNNLEKYYKGDYGLATTSLELRKGGSIEEPSGNWSYQWEYPNCWAPLMMVAVDGLKRYGYAKEALGYEKNWVQFIEKEFYKNGGFAEKSPYSSHVKVEKGFYGTVKGFGWTIAIYLQFLRDLAAAEML
jgi:alpha,alpha-trehalase